MSDREAGEQGHLPGGLDRIPAPLLVITSIASVQAGAAIAKLMFGQAGPTTMVWLRLVTSAVVLMLIARPRLRGRSRHEWVTMIAFGVVLALMNWGIYHSFARLPLGLAVTIEFLGPLLLAAFGSRRPRDLVWVLLAAAGVAMLGFAPVRPDWIGVLYALLAGAAWAGYIVLSGRVGRAWHGVSGLSAASSVGALTMTAALLVEGGLPELRSGHIWLLGAAVGLLSSVIPYSLELIALRRMPARVFGIMMSLEPAAAALAAMLMLHEFLSLVEWVAVACVVCASVGATRSGRRATVELAESEVLEPDAPEDETEPTQE